MAIQSPPRPLTFEDLEQITDPRHRYEILQGRLVVTAAPTPVHVIVATRISELASAHVRLNRLGTFFGSPVDVRITRHDIVEPDLCFVSVERNEIIGDKLIDGVPDLVVEVLSPSTRRDDLVRKMALYAVGGVREYWIIDPSDKSVRVTVFVDGVSSELAPNEQLIRSNVLPGIEIRLDDLFRDLPTQRPTVPEE